MSFLNCEKTVLAAVVMLLCIVPAHLNGQREKDPHRPACTSAPCQKIETFLRSKFCGASPFGNGPRNGCDTRSAKWVLAAADYGQANGSQLALCQVIVVVGPGGHVQVLRKVQFQKTNADK